MSCKSFLLSLFTDHDGDGEVVSVLGVLAVLVFLVLSIYTTSLTGTFAYTEFGTAVGLMLAGLGGGYFVKGKSTRT